VQLKKAIDLSVFPVVKYCLQQQTKSCDDFSNNYFETCNKKSVSRPIDVQCIVVSGMCSRFTPYATLCFLQMVIQDPNSGREYSFELKDRLIRDAELDGWKEIPAKPVRNVDDQTESGESTEVAEGDESSVSKATASKPLPGK
jgi:hypothetical protein